MHRRHSSWLILLAVIGGLLTGPDESAPAATVRNARSPEAERATFRLADDDLVIELVAAEPDVVSPVSIAWDEDGRMYVAEMRDYPTATTGGCIKLLEDRDGDGK